MPFQLAEARHIQTIDMKRFCQDTKSHVQEIILSKDMPFQLTEVRHILTILLLKGSVRKCPFI